MAKFLSRKWWKKTGRSAAKVVKYVAPVAAALTGGAAALIAAPLVSGAASTVGAKNKSKAFKRGLLYGGAVSAGSVGIGLLSGAGAGAGLVTSVPRLLGYGAPAAAAGPTTVDTSPLPEGQAFEPYPGGVGSGAAGVATAVAAAGGGIDAARFGSFLGRAARKEFAPGGLLGGEAADAGPGNGPGGSGFAGGGGSSDGEAGGLLSNPWILAGGAGLLLIFLMRRKRAA